ncbi:MAG TPA: lipid-A-disaccharide synthase [Ignavibacteria bacterium]|nr:lipid-A-disaccharide synthase [Ignavibacteria bacterium]HMR39052.1 lipid-A-disaccharide synthase [Ignavibacteria bacterium]
MKNKKIFVFAGESSGDMHAASLIRELKDLLPEISITGIGGPEMLKENVDLLYDLKQVNFIGFSSVIKNIRKIKSILNKCISEIKKNDPDAVILIDYPGFNLKLIREIRKFYTGKIIYYISPQLWAWHKSRVKIIQKFVDLMLVVFPFEVDFYSKENVKAVFVGHPLIKRIDKFIASNSKTSSDKTVISILPGSRKDEIERMLPVLVNAASLLKKEFNAEINFICSSNFNKSFYEEKITNKDFIIIYDENNSDLNYRTILNSDLVITKSGTSTMECALIGTPFCVVYKTGNLNYAIGKRLVDVEHIAMVNILLKRKAVKEFLQDEMTAENIFEEAERLINDKEYSEKIRSGFTELREILGNKDASLIAAKEIVGLLNIKNQSN